MISVLCEECKTFHKLIINAGEDIDTDPEKSCLSIRATSTGMCIMFTCAFCKLETEVPRRIEPIR